MKVIQITPNNNSPAIGIKEQIKGIQARYVNRSFDFQCKEEIISDVRDILTRLCEEHGINTRFNIDVTLDVNHNSRINIVVPDTPGGQRLEKIFNELKQ